MKHQAEIEKMFDQLVESISELLPDFGVEQAIDGKAIPSHANGKKRSEEKEPDGRRDTDANWGKKEYRGVHKDGTTWEKISSWFGYKLHLVVDAKYELPVTYKVTRAADSEFKIAPQLIEKIEREHPELLERCQFMMGDRGYDDSKIIKSLWDEYKARPVIDIRNLWKDGEETKPVNGYENVVYDYRGTISCISFSEKNKDYQMAYGGFEKDRMTLKYRCPAKHYGFECKSYDNCPSKCGVRIPLEEDRRVFLPLPRSSYRFRREYKKRTAVERVNSRIDNVFCFENHFK